GKRSWRPVGRPRTVPHTPDVKQFSCSFCTYTTSLKSHFVLHMRTHSGERPYQCHICSYRSTQKANLNRHLLMHQNV
ncbi:Zinc finger C2H2-type, partial [Trinorchestia longiramus]